MTEPHDFHVNKSPVNESETYQDTGFSRRRLRALCNKETRQILRDPSSGLIAFVIPPIVAVYIWLRHQSGFEQAAYWHFDGATEPTRTRFG